MNQARKVSKKLFNLLMFLTYNFNLVHIKTLTSFKTHLCLRHYSRILIVLNKYKLYIINLKDYKHLLLMLE